MADAITIYIDGGSRGNPGPAAFGVRVENGDGRPITEFNEAIGVATNNVAEYRGLLAGLQWALDHGHRRVRIRSDSELLVKQMRGEYRVKHPSLQPLNAEARRRASRFESIRFEHVPRERNAHADRLANAALDAAAAGAEPMRPDDARSEESGAAPTAPAGGNIRTRRRNDFGESLGSRESREFARARERINVAGTEAIRRQDAAAVAASFAPGAVMLVRGRPPLRGRAAIEEFYARSFTGPMNLRDATFTTWEFEVDGGLAVETGASTYTLGRAGQAEPTIVAGKYLAVWKRQSGGAWLLWRYAPTIDG